MAKAKKAYVCSECGAHSVKWAGQCPDCTAWNTLTEMTISPSRQVAATGISATTLGGLPDDIDVRHGTGLPSSTPAFWTGRATRFTPRWRPGLLAARISSSASRGSGPMSS